MKLRYELSFMEIDGEYSAVPVGPGSDSFSGMLKLNDIAVEILNMLKEDNTPEQIHACLKARYPDSDDCEIGEALVSFLNRLTREGLLIVP